jgi:hypothetical protein
MSVTPSPSRLPFLVVGVVLGAAVTFGLSRLGGSPAPTTAPPDASPSAPRDRGAGGSTDRAPQLSEGTFTVWYLVSPGNEQLRAIASRAPDGTEVWIMTPTWVAPSSSATNVTLRIQYESASTFTVPQDLLNWAGQKPAIRPVFHGQNLSAFVHDTIVVWNGSAPKFCVP